MKSNIAVKYVYDANPFYVRWKKHFCPNCHHKLELKHKIELVDSASPQAKNYDFSVSDTRLKGLVEFRIGYLYCQNCNLSTSFKEMKYHEKTKK